MWSAIVRLLASVFGFFAKRNEDNNTPEMKLRKQQQDDINERNKIEKAIAERDTDAVRRMLSD